MENRDNKKKLACPVCGNEELQFLSVQKEKEKSGELIAFFIIVSVCLSLLLLILSFPIIQAWNDISNDIVTTSNLKTLLFTITYFIIFSGVITLLVVCVLHNKPILENKIEYVCTNCGNHDLIEAIQQSTKE